jgi:L-iditol 2-dehydrogenase
MRALQLVGRGDLVVRTDAEVVPPAEGEVVVQTRYSSVCGSDLHTIFHGPDKGRPMPPGYPGHESVGTVVESRSERFAVGDVVLAVPDITCFTGFAELQTVPERFITKLPSGADPLHLVMAQQLGTVEFAFRRFSAHVDDPAGRTAVVYGAGSAGLHFISLLRMAGYANIVCGEVDPVRAKIALEHGATSVVDANELRVSDVVLEETQGLGAPMVIDAVGLDSCRADAVRAVADLGDLGFFGLAEHSGMAPFPFETYFRKRATIHTNSLAQREPDLVCFDKALRWIADGTVDVRAMVGTPYPIERGVEAVAAAETHVADSPKVVIGFD